MSDFNFMADGCKVSGPLKDGSYSVIFSTGEYQQEQVAQMMLLPRDKAIKVEVTILDVEKPGGGVFDESQD